jgi:hypothetical protein
MTTPRAVNSIPAASNGITALMARSRTRSNQKPDTLMQDRISPGPRADETSCIARPDHTLGHSRRYCHVRSLVRYPQHRTLLRPTETRLLVAFLRPICKQRGQPPPLLRPGFARSRDHYEEALLAHLKARQAGAVREPKPTFAAPRRVINLMEAPARWRISPS